MRYISTIVNYALYALIALFFYHTYRQQETRQQKNDQIEEANRVRAEEEQASNREANEKMERFMANIQHMVVVQIVKHDYVMCANQLDPNCEMVQQAIAEGQVKTNEIGTTDQQLKELVRQYKARYAQYYATQGQ